MIVAITVWGNRISPVFDSAQTLLLAEIRGKQIVDKKIEFMPLLVPVSFARKIVELGPDSLICGAISRQPAKIIEDAGISLVPFISGKAEPILRAYARNLEINRFCMPGCAAVCPRRNMKQAPAATDDTCPHEENTTGGISMTGKKGQIPL